MRVLQVSAYYPPSVGGVQTYVMNLSHALIAQGHEVSILTTHTEKNSLTDEVDRGIQIHRCRPNIRIYRAIFSAELSSLLLASRNFDLFHIHIPFHFGLETALLAGRRNHIPVIATHHGYGVQGDMIYSSLARFYNRFSQKFFYQRLNRIIFLSQSYAESLQLPASVENRMKIVRTGADLTQFGLDQKADIRARQAIDPKWPVVLFAGSLHKANHYKGVDVLLRAFSRVREIYPQARLLIAGDGPLRPVYRSLADSLGMDGTVQFLGEIDNHTLKDYYLAADLLALPSLHGPENSPVVVFEAMACGKPVVASCLPGLTDIISHGENGLLVRPGSVQELTTAIQVLIENKSLRDELGRKARKTAESYSWEHCAKDITKIYQELVSQ